MLASPRSNAKPVSEASRTRRIEHSVAPCTPLPCLHFPRSTEVIHGSRSDRRAGTLGPLVGRVGAGQERRHPLRRRPHPHARGGRRLLPRPGHPAGRQLSSRSSPTSMSTRSCSPRRTACMSGRSWPQRPPASTSTSRNRSRWTAAARMQRSRRHARPAWCSRSATAGASIPRWSSCDGVSGTAGWAPSFRWWRSTPPAPANSSRRTIGAPRRKKRRAAH